MPATASASDRRFDRLLAALCFLACETELALTWSQHSRPVLDAFLLAALTGPLLVRRRSPLLVTVVVMVVTVAAAAEPNGVFSLQTALFVVLIPPYSVGVHESGRRSVAGLAVCVAGLEVAVAIVGSGLYWAAFVLGAAVALWTLGRTFRTRRELLASLVHTQAMMRGERERTEQMALVAERQRIMLDLQSIVVDALGVMIDRSRSAQVLLNPDASARNQTGEAIDSITVIERTGQAALVEMRILLHLLRDVSPCP